MIIPLILLLSASLKSVDIWTLSLYPNRTMWSILPALTILTIQIAMYTTVQSFLSLCLNIILCRVCRQTMIQVTHSAVINH